MNIIDYAKQEKRTLSQLPFNEVDSLILSQLAYLNFDRALAKVKENNSPLLVGDFKETLKNYEQIFEHVRDPRSNKKLLAAVVANPRFRNFGVTNYINEVNKKIEKQFAAVTFVLDAQTIYVAFRGTDDTIIGWKEDFNLVYLNPIPAQKEAAAYLEKMAAKSYTKLFVGGHSKGGTLAAYSIINAPWRVKKEVVAVYNHDGPGFKMGFWQGWRAKLMSGKIKKTLPQSSIVGILLETNPCYDIVKSKRFGVMQHDPFSWQINGDHFVLVDRISKGSQYLDKTLKTWLGQLSSEKRALFVDTLFQIISASKVEDFSQLNKIGRSQIEAMIGAAKNLDQETQDFLKQTLKNLGKIYWHYLTAGVKKKNF
ncbi:MAG: DUF2974 domain-containing protein [bacterium]|nr:DUF2974 domain-containing protein [bacterium]